MRCMRKKRLKELFNPLVFNLSERIKKINDLLRDEVARIFLDELEKEDGILVTVTSADTSPTLEHTTIMISVFPKEKRNEIFKKLKKQIYHIQQTLNHRLNMRPIPKIRFEIDPSEERTNKIEEIFKNL